MFRSFVILFIVSVDTWLSKNLHLILNFFFIAFTLWSKANFLIVKLIVSFPDHIEVSSGQLKTFNESVIDPKCYWKLELHLLFWWQFILFKQHYIFLYITIFIWEVRFTCFLKWFGTTMNTKFLKVLQLGLFIQICHQVLLPLNLTVSIGFFGLIALFLRRDLIIICFGRFLSKLGLGLPRKIFVFLRACLSKIQTKLFSKAAWVLIADIRLQISNINWSIVWNCGVLISLVQTFQILLWE